MVIKKLEQHVINKIAAGEVIVRPWNAVKEIIENSLDAGANSITVSVKEGGMKFIKIEDDGAGISKEDLPLLCERYTTSKISTHRDLEGVTTYGFRGEALASVSNVAHVSVITMLHSTQIGYSAEYHNCKLSPRGIKPIASTPGTTICVEDLFYNVPLRKKALKKFSEEYSLILGIIEKYALHFHNKRFVCKKMGGSTPDVCTTPGSLINSIKYFYGVNICKHLIEVNAMRSTQRESVKGYVSDTSYHFKKFTFILFINDRLVECNSLKKAIQYLYSTLLPKGSYPFVYLDLKVDPTCVDVNTHPAKLEVVVLNQGSLNEWLVNSIHPLLLIKDDSRQLPVQKDFTFSSNASNSTDDVTKTVLVKDITKSQQPIHPSKLVRQTPAKESLDYTTLINNYKATLTANENSARKEKEGSCTIKLASSSSNSLESMPKSSGEFSCSSSEILPFRDIKFHSVLRLRKNIEDAGCPELTNTLSKSSYIGLVGTNHALLQSGTKLYLVNLSVISEELFRQLVVHGFGNFKKIILSSPINVQDFIACALKNGKAIRLACGCTDVMADVENFASKCTALLVKNRNMIEEYFSININSRGYMSALPLLLRGYIPNMARLSKMLLSLSVTVNWNEENECFNGISKEIAKFYSLCFMISPDVKSELLSDLDCQDYTQLNGISFREFKKVVEHIVLPAIRSYMIAPKAFSSKEYILELANLSHLYKIFERC